MTQAGSSPFSVRADFQMSGTPPAAGKVYADGNMRNAIVELPGGLIGNPTAVPQCPRAVANVNECPLTTLIGTMILTNHSSFFSGSPHLYFRLPLFNTVPRRGDVTDFGTSYLNVPIHITAGLNAADGYAVETGSREIAQTLETSGAVVNIWGVPGDPGHDPERTAQICGGMSIEILEAVCGAVEGHPAGLAPKAFLRLPTSCGTHVSSKLKANSWQEPSHWLSGSAILQSGITGCDKLTFQPSIKVAADTSQGDTPTGVGVDVTVPQTEGPNVLATPDLRKAVVQLPPGLVVNPSSADGLGSCAEAQIGLGSNDPGTCPENSKLARSNRNPAARPSLKASAIWPPRTPTPSASSRPLYGGE